MYDIHLMHEEYEKHYKDMFRMDMFLLVLLIVVALPSCIISGSLGFTEGSVGKIVFYVLLFAVNAFNTIWTVQRLINRYNHRKEENRLYERFVSLENDCLEEETDV